MTSTERRLRRILGRMLDLLRKTEQCNECIPPAMGLGPCHLEEWNKLVLQARDLLENGPN